MCRSQRRFPTNGLHQQLHYGPDQVHPVRNHRCPTKVPSKKKFIHCQTTEQMSSQCHKNQVCKLKTFWIFLRWNAKYPQVTNLPIRQKFQIPTRSKNQIPTIPSRNRSKSPMSPRMCITGRRKNQKMQKADCWERQLQSQSQDVQMIRNCIWEKEKSTTAQLSM